MAGVRDGDRYRQKRSMIEVGVGEDFTHWVLRPYELKRWRQFALLSQDNMGHELGISQGLLSRLEQGVHPIQKERVSVMVELINGALAAGGVDARCRVEDVVDGRRLKAMGGTRKKEAA